MTPDNAHREISVNQVSSNATCQSCKLMFPGTNSKQQNNSMKTGVREKHIRSGRTVETVYVSSQSPVSQSRYTALRLACLRALSSEHTFNDNTPMMFSDPVIGTAMVLVFKVADVASRGHVRRYALLCLGEDETMILNSWTIVAPRFEAIAKSIQDKARREVDNTDPNKIVPDRYLRIRDAKVQSRSLASIINDPAIFVELHAKFSKILSTLNCCL
jgi:hypothetical protein